MDGKQTIQDWLDTAVVGIRFKPDRKAVEAELRGHFEEKVADLERMYHLNRREAEEMALKQMGDPEEIGREMAKIHKPWWGYLWYATRGAVISLLVVSAICWSEYWWGHLANWLEYGDEPGYSAYLDECYLTGQVPFAEDNPFVEPGGDTSGIVRTPLLVSEGGPSTRCGNYIFKVGRNALWSFSGGSDPEEDWWLFLELEVAGPPWEPIALEAINQVGATDSLGNYYYNSHEIYQQNVERGEDGYVMVNLKETGFLTRTFYLEVIDIAPGAEWLRLEFERSGGAWSLEIPLEEVTS